MALVKRGIAEEPLLVFVVLPFVSQLLMIGGIVAIRILTPGLPSVRRWPAGKPYTVILAVLVLTITVLLVHVLIECGAASIAISTTSGIFLPTLTAGNAFLLLYTLRIVVLTPFVEELYWRMHFQGSLQTVVNPRTAIAVQAVLFAVAHMRGFAGSLEVLSIGVIYGLWQWRKGSLMPLILSHIILNGAACIGTWANEFELRMVAIKTDYRLPLQIMCRPVDYVPSDNAAYHYECAFTSFVDLPEGLDERDLKVWPGRLSVEKLALLRMWIESNRDALTHFAEATSKPYYCPAYTKMPIKHILYPPASGFKMIVLVALSRAQVSVLAQDVQQSVSDIAMCYRLSQHLTGPRPLIEQLLGATVQQRVTRTALMILAQAEIDEAYLRQLRSALEAISETDVAGVDFSGERLICHALIEQTFTDDGSGGGHIPRASIRRLTVPPSPVLGVRRYSHSSDARKWERVDRRETSRLADELFAYLASIERYTPAEVSRDGTDIQSAMRHIIGDNVFLNELIPSYTKTYYMAHRCRALRESLPVVIAIMEYRRAQGDLPYELGQLSREGYLDTIPLDPFSGVPFVYRKGAEDSLLYSVGPDRDDDGGIGHGGNGDDVFWPLSDD